MQDAITQPEPSAVVEHIPIRRTAASHWDSLNSAEIVNTIVICLVFASFAKRRTPVRSKSYPKNRRTWFLWNEVCPYHRGNRYSNEHLLQKSLVLWALNRIGENIADFVRPDSNGVVKLLSEYFSTVGRTRNFEFDDPASLDNDAYYKTPGFIKGKAFFYLLWFRRIYAFKSFQQLL